MTARREHRVAFFSPGSFFAESSTRPIPSWDTHEAVRLSREVVERYNATPYGFRFETLLTADDVPDGEGGKLRVAPRLVEKSGTQFIGARLGTFDELVLRNDPEERVLRSNMENNGWWIVAISTHGWRSVQPFNEGDLVVAASDGRILERGDDPRHLAYRGSCDARRRVELARWREKYTS